MVVKTFFLGLRVHADFTDMSTFKRAPDNIASFVIITLKAYNSGVGNL